MKNTIKKYTNYETYFAVGRTRINCPVFEISEERLSKVVEALRDNYSKPYMRFMWISNVTEPTLLLYNGEKMLRRYTFNELEKEVLNAAE